ncbi:centromere protein F [Hippocampus comes]|uniref:centromere protein F n=1 Tax=Hippocampus comes TaxID=109280 RepID=UPI00094F0BBA|nr:PREDICTED: centromere protein F-like [Hippocampus comes]XP_019718924.1 PREDICTED: centromere protein F-like [Hippocampus comes]
MSWAEEDWTAGLSGRVLQKVKELQTHHERLSRENKQKQLQLDNIHVSHDKQTVKYEEVRVELHAVRRELQSVREEAQVAVNGGHRLTQELQTKQAQVCSLEGQLEASRTLNNKLTQEIKRLEAELEKLQNSNRSADSTPFSTPCWSTSSPWEHHGSRKDERTVQNEQSHSSPPIRLRLQFPDESAASLPRQPKATTRSRPSNQSDSFATPLALAAFPWERDDPRPAARRASPSSPQTPAADHRSKKEASEREKDLSPQADTFLSQMRRHTASLEEELSVKAETLKSLHDEMAQGKKKMASTELSLQRAHNELSVAHARISQESERALGAEQRLKQLQEELKCQRQNAESSRLQHQQRTKELDKQHQRDLLELQKEKQCMEKQHQQEVNKLNQELQQARTLHNALQAQADKLSQQNLMLEKELESLKEKVKFTEGQLQESQKKETQIQAELKEVRLDAAAVAESLEQSKKRERALEEDAGKLAEERADALRLLKELHEQKAAALPDCTPLVPICPVGQSFSSQLSSHHTRPSAYTKRPSTPRTEPRVLKQEEEVQHRAEISISYPSDREPGEGIDSEHITADTECSYQGRNYEEKESSMSNNAHAKVEKDTIILNTLKSEQTTCTNDLQRENASLRSELCDVREELQKRLEDLEVQRCAEVEARTRLKQLRRKHASQGAEREEQDKQWKAQLEREKSENGRLRETLTALEKREEQNGTGQTQEDRETEIMQLTFQLKQQLGEVKLQLALEQERRERENNELTQITAAEREAKVELSTRLEELTAQIAELKSSKDEESLLGDKLVANGPLTCPTLHSDRLHSNITVSDNQVPSPEHDAHFHQSTNQLNTLATQQSQLSQTGPVASDLKDISSHHIPKDETVSSDLIREIERLRAENAQETERAEQFQIKLTALQNQLTSQTKQLTLGFEKQSHYVSGLLAELQEKDGALLCQGEELRRCIQELDALKDKITGEHGGAGRKKDNICEVEIEGLMEDALDSLSPFEPLSNRKTDFSVTSNPNEASHVVIQPHDFEGSERTQSINGGAVRDPDNGQALVVASRPSRHHEDQVLKQSTQTRILSDSRCVALSTIPSVLHDITSEMGSSHDEIINKLQTQVVALQRKLQKLTEVAQQQAEELAIWRLTSQPSSALDLVLPSQSETPTQHSAEDQSAALVIRREDEVLFSCISSRLQGRMLCTSLQQKNMPEMSVLHAPADMSQPSEKDPKPSEPCSSPHKLSDQQTAQKHVSKVSAQTSDVDSSGWTATKHLSISTDCPAISVSTQTEQLCPGGTESAPQCHCVHTQTDAGTEIDGEELDDASPHVPQAAPSAGRKTGDKMLFSSSFPIPADPVRLAERIRRNRTQLSAAFDDTEYEPYGLPEVVMKGFADIPTGPSCPYIVRRGLLGTAVVPITQKEANPEEETD